MKKLLLEMLIIISLVTAFGFWTLNEWRKMHPINGYLDELRMPKTSQHKQNFTAPKPVKVEKQVKVYQGIWHKTYLEVMK